MPAFAAGAGQGRLRVMECQTVRQDRVIPSLEQCDQTRLQRHAPLARQVARVAGAAQQALHPARPVLLLELAQRLQFPQLMRVAQRTPVIVSYGFQWSCTTMPMTFANRLPRLGEADQRVRQAQLDGMVRGGETR